MLADLYSTVFELVSEGIAFEYCRVDNINKMKGSKVTIWLILVTMLVALEAVPIVIDCVIYECQESLLLRRIQQTHQYVDYYVVVEGQTKDEAGFCFDRLRFKDYNHKIVYVPIRNIPRQFRSLKESMGFVDATFHNILNLLALDEDIIIFSKLQQIISKQATETFKQEGLYEKCFESSFDQKAFLIRRHHLIGNYRTKLQLVLQQKQCFQLASGMTSIVEKQQNSSNVEARVIENTQYQPINYADQQFQPIKQLRWMIAGQVVLFLGLLLLGLKAHQEPGYFSYFPTIQQAFRNFDTRYSAFRIRILAALIMIIAGAVIFISMARAYHDIQLNKNGIVYPRRRLVFDCMAYNGEDHLLDLKFRITRPFVNFNILTEGAWSHTGVAKPLRFNYSLFDEYANKIIYLPIRNMPNMVGLTGFAQKYQNEHLMRLGAVTALRAMGQGRDIIVVGDIDEMLSPEAFLQFDPYHYEWMGTQMRHFHYYFNRLSVFDTPQRKQLPNYWLHGTRITTIEVVKQKISFQLNSLRFDHLCPDKTFKDIASVTGDYNVSCKDHFIPMAGWHFTSVLDDEHLLLKMRQSADYDKNYTIDDFENYRKTELAPNGYNIDVGLFDTHLLPNQLIKDVLSKGKESRFSKYLVGLDLDNFTPINISQLENNRKTSFQLPQPIIDPFSVNKTIIQQGVCWQPQGQCTRNFEIMKIIFKIGIYLLAFKLFLCFGYQKRAVNSTRGAQINRGIGDRDDELFRLDNRQVVTDE